MKLQIKEPLTLEEKAAQLVELELIQKDLKNRIATYKAELLTYMQDKKVLGLKLEEYTLTRAKRITPQVEDFATLKKSLEDAGLEVYTEEVFAPQMNLTFKQAISEGREFKGLQALETEYITVRIKDVKGGEKVNE